MTLRSNPSLGEKAVDVLSPEDRLAAIVYFAHGRNTILRLGVASDDRVNLINHQIARLIEPPTDGILEDSQQERFIFGGQNVQGIPPHIYLSMAVSGGSSATVERMNSTAMSMLFDITQPELQAEKMHKEAQNRFPGQTWAPTKPELGFLQALNAFIRYMGYIAESTEIRGFDYMKGTHRFTSREAIINYGWDPDVSTPPNTVFSLDPKMVCTYVLSGAFQAVGMGNYTPFSHVHRRIALLRLLSVLRKESGTGNRATRTSMEEHVTLLFKQADQCLFRSEEGAGMMEMGTFDELEDLIKIHYSPRAVRRNTKGLEKKIRRLTRETGDSLVRCNDHASRLPATGCYPLVKQTGMHLPMHTLRVVDRPAIPGPTSDNVHSSGFVEMEGVKLRWELNENGELSLLLGGESYTKSDFLRPHLGLFFAELKHAIASTLEGNLVRRDQVEILTGEVTNCTQRALYASSTELVEAEQHPLGVVHFDYRDADPQDIEDKNKVKQVKKIPAGAQQIIALLERAESVSHGDMQSNGNPIRLYQEEVRDLPEGRTVTREMKVYVPVVDAAAILNEVKEGRLPKSAVYMEAGPGFSKRAGYQPSEIRSGKRSYTQRLTPLTDAMRNHFKARGVGVIEPSLEEKDQRFMLHIGEEVTHVVMIAHGENGVHRTTMDVDDLVLLSEGCTVEDGLPEETFKMVDQNYPIQVEAVFADEDNADGVREVVGHRVKLVLQTPQSVQFVQGEYMNLDEIEALLA